jgi:hypothetical protein
MRLPLSRHSSQILKQKRSMVSVTQCRLHSKIFVTVSCQDKVATSKEQVIRIAHSFISRSSGFITQIYRDSVCYAFSCSFCNSPAAYRRSAGTIKNVCLCMIKDLIHH